MKKTKRIIFFVMFVTVVLIIPLIAIDLSKLDLNKRGDQIVYKYDAEITSSIKNKKAKPNQNFTVPLTLKNQGSLNWNSNTDKHPVKLAYHVLDKDKDMILRDGLRTGFPHIIKKGEKIIVNAKVSAPDKPGIYYIEFDLVHELKVWFSQKKVSTYIIKLKVK